MTLLEALILGIIQGLTEFLPVSSSGHLVIAEKILGIEGSTMYFNVMVHLATLAAVCIALWSEVLALIKKPFCRMTGMLVIATIPAVAAGLLLNDIFEEVTASGVTVGFGLLVTGAVLLVSSALKPGDNGVNEMKWHHALIAGIAQAIAIIPGISRSGMTISANIAVKMNRELAVKFAFLMSIPVILGGFALETMQLVSSGSGEVEWLPVLAGMVAAGLSGYFAIKFFIKTVMKGKLKWFAYYAFAVAVLVLADQLFFGIFFDRLF